MDKILDNENSPKREYAKKGFYNFLITLSLLALHFIVAGTITEKGNNKTIGVILGLLSLAYIPFSIRGVYLSIKSVRNKEPNSTLKVVGFTGNIILILPIVLVFIMIILMIMGFDLMGWLIGLTRSLD